MSHARCERWAGTAALLLLLGVSSASLANTGKVIGWEVDGKHYRTEIEACLAAARYNSSTGKGVFTGKFERQGEDMIMCEIRDVDGSVGMPQVQRVWGPADEPSTAAVGEAVPLPAERGMTEADDVVFRGLAMNQKLILIVRESNKAAVRFTGKPGYAPKPETLKAKTIQGDPAQDKNVGLASANPADPRLKEMLRADFMEYPTYLLLLRKHGYKVGPAPHFLVSDARTGVFFYSDIDLHGVYDTQGRQRWNKSLIGVFNARLKDRLIQHGPHDCWEKRNSPEAGPNGGPQPPVTVYMPDGTLFYLRTQEQMQAFYAQHKLPWPYAKGAKARWCD